MGRRRQGPALFAEMNLIPLIDIALIIMIILMVLTPMLVQTQLSVKLPKATAPDPADRSKTLEVEVRGPGEFLLNGRRFDRKSLERELILRLKDAGDKRVLVQADRDVPVRAVVFVLDLAKKLGVGELGIGVDREK